MNLFAKNLFLNNMKVETVSPGTIALIQQTETGRILQVAMTDEQSKMLQILLGSISQSSPLVQMGEEYDLVLKSTLCDKCLKNDNKSESSDNWIDVNKELPEMNSWCFFYYGQDDPLIGCYKGNGKFLCSEDGDFWAIDKEKISHWMYLPSKPKNTF